MELRQLKYFVKTAELLSFSKAAKALYITQSTLSQQIKQLEDELDMALFFRSNHKVSLTEAGETFLEGAKKTLAEADDNKAKILDLAHGHRGTLNIGVTYSFGSILTESVLAFKKEYPEVVLNICYKNVMELMELVSEGELDFALSFRSSEKYDNVESHILFDNKLSIIVREDHPLTRKEWSRRHHDRKSHIRTSLDIQGNKALSRYRRAASADERHRQSGSGKETSGQISGNKRRPCRNPGDAPPPVMLFQGAARFQGDKTQACHHKRPAGTL